MPLHFTAEEHAERRARTCALMQQQDMDALLIFRQESMFYLTGYDTFGYVYFQCLILTADGGLTLLTRAPDLRQARHTSMITDIRVWEDRADATPGTQLRDLLSTLGLKGKRLGIEWEAYGLTANNGRMVDKALTGFCTLADASHLISGLRLVKSPAELAYVRTAAELGDAALEAGIAHSEAGAFEGDILAAMQGAVFKGGGDYPGNEFIIGSGPGALLCRYFTGRRHLDPQDQMTLEFAGAYRRYHAALMRTLVVGTPPPRQQDMHKAATDALLAAEAALRPGQAIGGVFDAHAAVLDKAGFQAHRLNACGYSLGTTFAPNWMDWPMFYTGNPVVAAAGMVFFIHIIIMDSDSGLAMSQGRTYEVTATGAKSLSRASLELIVR